MVIHPNGIDPPMKFLTIIHACVLLLLHITLSAQVERRDTLREAVITGYHYIRWDGGKVETRIEGARAVASPLGEGDPLRWIQALPGVSMGADGSSAAYVRGGNVGGNLITLDGIPVYGYSHLLGLATVLPNDAIESVSFSKGGFGGNQGNFSASHIAVLSKDIPADRLHSSVTVNNFLLGGNVSAPVSDKISAFLSGRISPLGPEYRALRGLMGGGFGELDNFKAGVGDLYWKLIWKTGGNNYLSASFLSSIDRYAFTTSDGSDDDLGWGNLIGNVTYHTSGERGNNDLSLSYNAYQSTQGLSNSFHGKENDFRMKSTLREITLSEDFAKRTGGAFNWGMGGKVRYSVFEPGIIAGTVNRKHALYASAFWQGKYDTEKLMLEGTLRPNVFWCGEFLFSPDVNLKGKWSPVKGFAIEATFDRMSQFYHTLEGLPVGWSMDMIVPSTASIPAETAIQGYVGIISSFGSHSVSLGAFAKQMNGLVYFKNARDFFSSSISSWEGGVDTGKGDSKGVELMYGYQGEDLFVQVSATLSESTRKDFSEVNGGRPFHAPFDRRFVANLSALWKGISLGFTWQDGNWVNGTGEDYSVLLPDGDEVTLHHFASINSHHMPAVIRLDAGYELKWEGRKTSHSLKLGIFNLLNHFNPFTVYYDTVEESWKELALMPILPNFSYRVTF